MCVGGDLAESLVSVGGGLWEVIGSLSLVAPVPVLSAVLIHRLTPVCVCPPKVLLIGGL